MKKSRKFLVLGIVAAFLVAGTAISFAGNGNGNGNGAKSGSRIEALSEVTGISVGKLCEEMKASSKTCGQIAKEEGKLEAFKDKTGNEYCNGTGNGYCDGTGNRQGCQNGFGAKNGEGCRNRQRACM